MTIHDLGRGHVIEVPVEWSVSLNGTETNGDCSADQVRADTVSIAWVGAGCTDDVYPTNGHSGVYLSPEQTTADVAEVVVRQVAAGTVEVFDQSMNLCTNECWEELETVALLTLDDPPDPDFPVLQFVAAEVAAVEDMVALAEAVRIG